MDEDDVREAISCFTQAVWDAVTFSKEVRRLADHATAIDDVVYGTFWDFPDDNFDVLAALREIVP